MKLNKKHYVGFEVFTVVIMKKVTLWEVALCGSYSNIWKTYVLETGGWLSLAFAFLSVLTCQV
jgi:hypothetical protein